MSIKNLCINGLRLQHSIEEMSKIGAIAGGGIQRLSLTDEDKDARDLFVHWLKELNLDITIDEVGNIFGKRPGRDPDLPTVMSGSHLDSQPKGGRFDGTLGVLGALEVLRTIEENSIETDHPITIVNWTNEEGTRFSPVMSGSGVWVGALERDWLYNRTDIEGKRFVDELDRIGYKGSASAKHDQIHNYFECHIEQGPILERACKTIGVPKGIVGIHWSDVYIKGETNHVGSTPMEGRHNALCAAAEMILKVDELPAKLGGNMVATSGEIHNHPNSRNTIPGDVHFTIDMRAWEDDLIKKGVEDLENSFEEIAQKRGCPIRIEETLSVSHAAFDQKLVQRILRVSENLDLSNQQMVSGAVHDASYITQIAPTAMIFVPSIGGRSHVEIENTTWPDCEAGANVLLHCLLKSAVV